MLACTSNFAWYLGKFIVGFSGILFLYVSFLREKEMDCVCGSRRRQSLREKSETQLDRCEYAKGMQDERYLCGCSKPMRLTRDGDVTPTVSNDVKDEKPCPKSRCCTRRNSY